jgi:hypothetical protein
MAGVCIELEGQERAHGATGGNPLRARQARLLQEAVYGDASQIGQEQEQPAEGSANPAGREVQQAHVGRGSILRMYRRGALLIAPAR